MNRLLLCTDMDRTIIPNGHQLEHASGEKRFRQICALSQVKLVYVTGRHLQLVNQAIVTYGLPKPDYAITDVGTKIYKRAMDDWTEILSWQKLIAGDWKGKSHGQLHEALTQFAELTLQENNKQNDFKLSYYVPLDIDSEYLLKQVEMRLLALGVEASVVWSIDEPEHIGLLDILPRNATKLHGIQFLQQLLGYGLQEVLFAGDSGNDLQVLTSPIRSILVANAEQGLKQQAIDLVKQKGYEHSLYLAHEEEEPLAGNYSAGVVQGIDFFMPEIVNTLKA